MIFERSIIMEKPSFCTRFIKTFREQAYNEWIEGLDDADVNASDLQQTAGVATEISTVALNKTIHELGLEILDEQEG